MSETNRWLFLETAFKSLIGSAPPVQRGRLRTLRDIATTKQDFIEEAEFLLSVGRELVRLAERETV